MNYSSLNQIDLARFAIKNSQMRWRRISGSRPAGAGETVFRR
jgi:hypothetical protein